VTPIALAGYGDLRTIGRSGEVLSLIGTRDDGLPVMVRTHASDLPTPVVRELLADQAETARFVRHPSIAPVLDLIELPTRAALVAALPKGTVLSELPARTLSPVEILQLAIDLVPGLAELHVHGVGHGGITIDSVAVDGEHPNLASPWSDGRRTLPADDQKALADLIVAMLQRSSWRIPQGLRVVLDAARHPDAVRRYRSVVGFRHDLQRCRTELAQTDMCTPFAPNLDRFALNWRDPVAAFGLRPLAAQLGETISDLSTRGVPSMVVIEGPAGAGRSSLLHALDDHLGAAGVMRGLARFRTSGETQPLRAPRDLIARVVDDLVTRPPLRDAVAAALGDRLGADVALAAQLAPSLSRVVGLQPAPAEGAALDVAARVEAAGRAIVGAIAEVAQPLVAIFDDADAADAASLAALRVMSTVRGPLVVVLARRTDAAQVAMAEMLDSLEGTGITVDRLTVPPLDRSTMHAMIADGLGLSEGSGAPLANALWARSGGNPGLAIADLQTLLATGDVQVDPHTAEWSWSASALQEAPSPGVTEVTRQRVQRVPPQHRQILCAAAIAGRLATPAVLALALDRSVETTTAVLDRLAADQLLEWRSTGMVQFHDDSLRRAAADHLEGPERSGTRVRLARALMAISARATVDLGAPSDDERFEVLQLLDGHEHALTAEEAATYAAWSEDAARAAHGSGGYGAALELQLRALAVLGPVGWSHEPERMFELHLRAAQNALVVGRTSLVDQLLDTAWAHQPTAMQRVRALRLLGNRWWTRQDQSGGLAEMQSILRDLGERFPSRPTVTQVAREFLVTKRALRGRTPESFLSAPPLEDERVRALLDTMLSGVHLAYTSEPLTHVVLVLRGLRLTARHGVCPASAYFVAGYGLLLCGLGRDLPSGIGYGRAGMALADRHGGAVHTMVTFADNGFVRHWGEPLHDTVAPMLDEYRAGLATGTGGYAHTCGTFAALHSLLSSRPLPRVDDMAAEMIRELEALGEGAFVQRVKLVAQAVSDLRYGVGEREPLDGPLFSAIAWEAAKPRKGEFALMVHTVRAFIALVQGRLDVAAASVRAATPHVRSAPGEAIVGVHSYQLALLGRLGADVDRRAAKRAERRVRRAAAANPYDYGHRIALLDAVGRQGQPAAFDEVAASARRHEALADLAVIAALAERAATDPGEAMRWRAAAIAALRAWGAEGVARSLS